MPERLVQARFAASPASVLAALTARLHLQGDHLTGIAGFGTEVTWNAFDGDLELVGMHAEIRPDPDFAGCTLLVVRRVDPALHAALDLVDGRRRYRSGPGPRRLTG